jgi:hypothetical protein
MKEHLIGLMMSVIMISASLSGCLEDAEEILEQLESFDDCIDYYLGVEEAHFNYSLSLRNNQSNSLNDTMTNNTSDANNSSNTTIVIHDNDSVIMMINWNLTMYEERNETLEQDCEEKGYTLIDEWEDERVHCLALTCECDRRYCGENNTTIEIDWENMTEADRCRWDGGSWETLNNTTTEGACVIICFPEEWNTTANNTLDCREGERRISPDGCNECFCDSGNWSCTEKACENSEEENDGEETHRCNEENATGCED